MLLKNMFTKNLTESLVKPISGIGSILFERSKKAKRVSITVRPGKGVRVAVPFGISFKKAENFVIDKREWIGKHLKKMKEIEKAHQAGLTGTNKINREEARRTLVSRLDVLADRHGFSFNRVFIRNQKTRWGSCSFKNNINLNVNLYKLPKELVDYVILHELVHTKIKNHGPVFWAELDKYVGDARKIDKRLKKYRLGLL